MEFDMPKMEFELQRDSNSIIKVIGVGGGGSNAVNHMFSQGIVGVDFIVCNTDRQALDISPVPFKIQLGPNLTEGRGAGMIPEVGMNAAIENIEEIRELLSKNTKMVFVTAGMGGGTGTGAAPVIAQVAKDLGILTVGIVTVPFSFEGRKRRQQAEEGLEKMRQNVDTLLIINNERLREFGKNMSLSDAFGHADNILTIAAKGIAEVISVTGSINVDFNDVNTVLRNSGRAIMGSGIAEGDNRSIIAVKSALTSPLLNDNDINGARYVLLNITYGNAEVMMDEITDITDYIQDAAGATADIIWGHGFDASLGDKISITLIATGFSPCQITDYEKASERVLISMDDDTRKEITAPLQTPVQQVQTVTEQLKQTPFLKSEETSNEKIDNYQNSTEVKEEIKMFNLFEQPKLEEKEKEENKNSADNVQKYSWDIVEIKSSEEENEKIAENNITKTESSSSLSDDKIIIRHELKIETNNTASVDNSPKKEVLSPEEMNRKTNERMSRIQDLTTKLKKAEGITEFEKEPAYVRRNINLNHETPSTETPYSKFGLSGNADGSATLRGNNFLHDNVD